MTKKYFLELFNPKTGEYHTQGIYETLEEAEKARDNYYNPNYPNGADLTIDELSYDDEGNLLDDIETY